VKHAPRLPREFFRQETVRVARCILGQRLVHQDAEGIRLAGIISEAEAYVGSDDLACHARVGRTQRNATMWGEAGHAYVYFTYGMHWMLNLVTERAGYPAAVLLRAVIPVEGVDQIRKRRFGRPDAQLTDGPAKLCQAFNINRRFDGHDLCDPAASLFIERGVTIGDQSVTSGPRVGLNNVEEPWKSMPWRFRIARSFAKQIQEEIGS
jgi:DNA-3-methyladenine glycosylase